jgi:hypothetical protein
MCSLTKVLNCLWFQFTMPQTNLFFLQITVTWNISFSLDFVIQIKICYDKILSSFWYLCFIISYYAFNLLHNHTTYFEKCIAASTMSQKGHCDTHIIITRNNENTKLRWWNVEIMKSRMQKVESTMTSTFTSKARKSLLDLLLYTCWCDFIPGKKRFQKELFII